METPNLSIQTLEAIFGAITNLYKLQTQMTVFINLKNNHRIPPQFGVKGEKVAKHRPVPVMSCVPLPGLGQASQQLGFHNYQLLTLENSCLVQHL